MVTSLIVQPATDRTAGLPTAALPGAGPAWFGSVMGTGILATLLGLHADQGPGLRLAAAGLLLVGWSLLVALGTATVGGFARDPGAAVRALADPATMPAWGLVAMGLMSIGSATLTVTPSVVPAASGPAVRIDAALWAAGTLIGLLTAVGFATVLITRGAGRPSPVWGLPVVPPMVSASTGAALVPHLGSADRQLALLVVGIGCFFLALFLGVLVFGICYLHLWRVRALPVEISTSAWIPLGIVGQSTAAAQVLTMQAGRFLDPASVPALGALADAYGLLMLLVGVPVVGYAVHATVRGFAARMPFGPGWWALTFPLGTVALGSHLLASSTGRPVEELISRTALAALLGTWTLCATATVAATFRRAVAGFPGDHR